MSRQKVKRASDKLRVASEERDAAIREAVTEGLTMREVATAAGLTRGRVHQIVHAETPWTEADERRAKELRGLVAPTDIEREELASLRRREIEESVRRRTH